MPRISPYWRVLALYALAWIFTVPPAIAETRMWIKKDGGIRRTCPSMACGTVGRFFPGESVLVYESVDGWSRVSIYYSAGCFDGRSAYVEEGPDRCLPENGIKDGEFAEWTLSDTLSSIEADKTG